MEIQKLQFPKSLKQRYWKVGNLLTLPMNFDLSKRYFLKNSHRSWFSSKASYSASAFDCTRTTDPRLLSLLFAIIIKRKVKFCSTRRFKRAKLAKLLTWNLEARELASHLWHCASFLWTSPCNHASHAQSSESEWLSFLLCNSFNFFVVIIGSESLSADGGTITDNREVAFVTDVICIVSLSQSYGTHARVSGRSGRIHRAFLKGTDLIGEVDLTLFFNICELLIQGSEEIIWTHLKL